LGPDIKATLRLEESRWRNWVLVISLMVTVTLGLSGAILLIRNGSLESLWPWGNTEVVLITGLSLVVLFSALYLTQQQRKLSRIHRQLLLTQQDAARRISRHFDRLVAILNVSRTMGSETDPQSVLQTITDSCLGTFDCDRVSLMILDRNSGELEVRSASGDAAIDQVVGTRVPVGEGIAGWVAEHKKPLILGGAVDPETYANFTRQSSAPSAAMVVPIVLRGELVGVMNVAGFSDEIVYDEEDLHALMVFAENAGICCRHTEQAEWMRQTIQRLDSALTHRSPDSRAA